MYSHKPFSLGFRLLRTTRERFVEIENIFFKLHFVRIRVYVSRETSAYERGLVENCTFRPDQ